MSRDVSGEILTIDRPDLFRVTDPAAFEEAAQRHIGPNEYARRCLMTGQLLCQVIKSARECVKSDRDIEVMGSDFYALAADFPEVPRAEAGSFINAYLTRMRRLSDYYRQHDTDAELYADVLNRQPENQIAVSCLTSGLVIWCSGDDYASFFTKKDGEVTAQVREEARTTAGVATARKGGIPVCAVRLNKRYDELIVLESTSADQPDIQPIPLGSIAEIQITFGDDQNMQTKIKISDDHTPVGKHRSITATDLWEGADPPHLYLAHPDAAVVINRGAAQLIINGDDLQVGWVNNSTPTEVTISTINDANCDPVNAAANVRTDSVARHEITHLLTQLREAERIRLGFRMEKREPSGRQSYSNHLARFLIQDVLDPHIRTEFLSSLYHSSVGVDPRDIYHMLAEEVETCGLHYDYVSKHKDDLLSLIDDYSGAFPNVAAFKYRVLAAVTTMYRQELARVAKAVYAFTQEFPQFDVEEHTDNLVGLLAPHPFHALPTVLRTVSRYLRAEQSV